MINTSFNLASIAGIIIAVAGAALYAIRSVRPELSRDHDIFFSAIGLLCGLILIFQGWRFDPIMQFGQILLTGATIFFAVENLRLRGITTKQAKGNTPIVDEDRPVSSVYRYEEQQAELDELEPIYDQRPTPRRIRGTKDARSTRVDEYDGETPRRSRTDAYEDEARPRSSNRGSSVERLGQGDQQPRRRPRPTSRPIEQSGEDEWSSPSRSNDDWDLSDSASKSPSSGSNGSSRLDRNSDTSKPRRRRPPQNSVPQQEPDEEGISTEYVDYKPVDRSDDEPDNSQNFDER